MKRILIADNQFITRKGISSLLEEREDTVIRSASSKVELIDFLKDFPDTYVILDYTLFDFRSIDELLIISTRFPAVHWLLFSAELSASFLEQIYFNTTGFSILYKECSGDEIKLCLQEVLQNRRYVCAIVSNILLNNVHKQQTETEKTHLTAAEKEILREIASGKTTKEIAELRHSSTHTIISHRKNIFRKIEANNIHEATKYAVKAGLVDLSDYFI